MFSCLKEKERKPESLFSLTENFYVNELDIKLDLRGQYKTPSKQAKGLVVHYTAGHNTHGKSDAVNTMKSLSKRGLGCLTMDYDGNIYKASNQGWSDVAYHAGSSSWKGKSGVSRYCMGMEICCPGKLIESFGEYYPWYAFKDDGSIRRNAKHIDQERVNLTARDRNIKGGVYEMFSEAQEQSLINFISWQLEVNTEFQIDWVVGHDEISPRRKSDPGGSLSLNMNVFREKLKDL